MSRYEPRPLSSALADLTATLAPASTLARVQTVWDRAVGPAIAGSARPAAEHDGVLTVICAAAVWAQELDVDGIDSARRLERRPGLRHPPRAALPDRITAPIECVVEGAPYASSSCAAGHPYPTQSTLRESRSGVIARPVREAVPKGRLHPLNYDDLQGFSCPVEGRYGGRMCYCSVNTISPRIVASAPRIPGAFARHRGTIERRQRQL